MLGDQLAIRLAKGWIKEGVHAFMVHLNTKPIYLYYTQTGEHEDNL